MLELDSRRCCPILGVNRLKSSQSTSSSPMIMRTIHIMGTKISIDPWKNLQSHVAESPRIVKIPISQIINHMMRVKLDHFLLRKMFATYAGSTGKVHGDKNESIHAKNANTANRPNHL